MPRRTLVQHFHRRKKNLAAYNYRHRADLRSQTSFSFSFFSSSSCSSCSSFSPLFFACVLTYSVFLYPCTRRSDNVTGNPVHCKPHKIKTAKNKTNKQTNKRTNKQKRYTANGVLVHERQTYEQQSELSIDSHTLTIHKWRIKRKWDHVGLDRRLKQVISVCLPYRNFIATPANFISRAIKPITAVVMSFAGFRTN